MYQEDPMFSYHFPLVERRLVTSFCLFSSSRWPQQESASAAGEIAVSDLHQLQDLPRAEANEGLELR